MTRPEAESPLSQEVHTFLRKHCPMRGTRLSHREVQYLRALDDLTPEERAELAEPNRPPPKGLEEHYLFLRKALDKRIAMVVDEGIHPRVILAMKRPSPLDQL